METLSKQQLSSYRQSLKILLSKIEKSFSLCLFSSPVVRATPGEVFRKCGKKNCKCFADDSARHGPYKVLQVYRDGKQRQVSLRKDQLELWTQAKHYQYQIKNLDTAKAICTELLELLASVIEKRCVEIENDVK